MPEDNIDENLTAQFIHVEQTLAIIKPDAVEHFEEIEEILLSHGFTMLRKRRVHLTPEQTSEFYSEHYGKMFFPSLVAYMSSGPIIAMILARENAITYWRQIIGPTQTTRAREEAPNSIRALFGTDNQRNAVHGSDSELSALREIHFFFPDVVLEPIPSGQQAHDYLARAVNPTLLAGLTELCKKKPIDPLIWLSEWLLENNPNKPKVRDPGYTIEEPDD